jgi:hypothetical protein
MINEAAKQPLALAAPLKCISSDLRRKEVEFAGELQ